MIKVALSPSFMDNNTKIFLNRDYTEAVKRAGALPFVLPMLPDPEQWAAVLDTVDALILTGGADVDPATYGEEKLDICGEICTPRDKMEVGLCRMALERDMPILAICRGEQILNCALGGSLFQDVAAQYGPELEHPVYSRPKEKVHTVHVRPDSRLAAITGMTELQVNSRHHQAVNRVGEGLVVTARATDGLIEGVELPGKKFVVGIQWHPESLSDYAPEAQALFNAFVAAAQK